MKTEKVIPSEGDYLFPDGWHKALGEKIKKDDGFNDSCFPGCEWRIKLEHRKMELAINLVVTGKPHVDTYNHNRQKSRVKIEWVGDGVPSEFSGGWLYHDRIN